MLLRGTLVLLPLLVVLSACAPTAPTGLSAERDVVVDGVSILGSWDAIGAPDQADVDSDLRTGQLTRMLVFNPGGRVTLTGEDRRAGTGRTTFRGQISGRTVTFDELPGRAIVDVRSSNRLVLTDPAGNRTVYQRRR